MTALHDEALYSQIVVSQLEELKQIISQFYNRLNEILKLTNLQELV